MQTKKKLTLTAIIFFLSLGYFSVAKAATEFVSIVDPGNGADTDYTTLSLWEAGAQTDLTAATTQVFAGTRDNAVADNATVYLCDSANSYRGESATVVHSTATQILVESIASAVTEVSTDYWYSTNTCSGGTKYFTLSDGGDSAIAVAKCRTSSGAADTGVTISDWTTSATNYVKIWTDPAEPYRHEGMWDETKYRIDERTSAAKLRIGEPFTRIDGLQVSATEGTGYELTGAASINTGGNIISNSIAKSNGATSGTGFYQGDVTSQTDHNYVYNCIAQGNWGWGFYIRGQADSSRAYVYSSTAYGAAIGFRTRGYGYSKNLLSIGCTDAYLESSEYVVADYLAYDEGTDPGTNGVDLTSYDDSRIFEDAANSDFHLDSSSPAKNVGYDTSGESAPLNFTTDIDGNTRSSWDIGADENIAKIYRSVGPSATTALITGKGPAASQYQANHLTISGITATFELPLPDNVGVGDAIQYDANNDGSITAADGIAFIDKRFSSFQYRIKAASGAAPTAMAVPDIDWRIFRSYISLYNAEAGTENTGIDDDLETFDAGNVDLTTNNLQWNFACYANGTTADTAAVAVSGWTTTADNYIKIYTPTRSDEVGTLQRHLGLYSTSYYRMAPTTEIPLTVSDEDVRIEGLQFYSADNDGIYINGATGASHIQFSQNIIKGNSTAAKRGLNLAATGSTSTAKIWNNIIYDYSGAGSAGIYWNDADWTPYIYNNTFQNDAIGLDRGNDTAHYTKNNLISATDAFNGTFTDSDTNNDYNSISENSADVAIGTNGKYNQTFTFTDETGDDFHLAPNDAGAKNYGTDLSNDLNLNFNTDIDSTGSVDMRCPLGTSDVQCNTRPYNTTWDIGADEVITKIYRSVAPDADGSMAAIDDDNSQADTLTITTAGAATFEVAVTDIVGVGDALVWDDDGDNDLDVSDTILFIHGRTDSTHYTLKQQDGTNPSVGTTDNDKWAIYRAYTSLSNAEAGTKNTAIPITFTGGNRDIKTNSEQWYFACYANGTTADTALTAIASWTTSATNYIKIYTPYLTTEVGTSQRHQGEWDTNKYRIEAAQTSNDTAPIYIGTSNVIVSGLQIYHTNSTIQQGFAIWAYGATNVKIDSCILRRNTGSSAITSGISFEPNAGQTNVTGYAYNNIIYDHSTGSGIDTYVASSRTSTVYAYNNTVYGCSIGLRANSGGGIIKYYAKNNIVKGSGDTNAYVGTFTYGTDYNATDGTDTIGQGSNNRVSQTFTFADETNDDFHLVSSDAGAKDYGADLSQDPIFQKYMDMRCPSGTSDVQCSGTDIDGAGRPRTGSTLSWDIGADEVATAIYRSVGPSRGGWINAGDSNHLNISGSTATFDSALSDIIGVGDALQYDDNNSGTINAIAFITGRTSSTVYTIKSAVGGSPVPQTAADEVHWQIYRAYSSLSSAEQGNENSGLNDAVENFDDWTSGGTKDADDVGRDIWTNNEQWNIAAYANGTTADSTATTIDGWTTGAQNYIKVYTPTATTEVGTSQRHSGKWDDGKYKIEASSWIVFDINDKDVRVDGLQIYNSSTSEYSSGIAHSANSTPNEHIYISNSIIKGANPSSTGHYGINLGDRGTTGGSIYRIWNNIIYNIGTGNNSGGIKATPPSGFSYIYNNTVYNTYYGYNNPDNGGTGIFKNNIAQNCNDGFYAGWSFGTGSNYNLSDISGDTTGGANDIDDTEVTFVDEAGKDFHLDPTDIGARNAGADLSADTALAVTTDIDGKTRPNQGAFDIGADEAAKGVYYSVGQNVTDHKSGSPTMTISGGIAIFTEAQTAANLGVGDKVTYNTSSIVYLLRKVDTTHWYIITATGAIPADDATARTVDSIAHAYASLFAAEAGASDSDHMNATDLAANDFQLNLPCYNDAGAADTTAVTVDGWTTGPNNFIKIYTPTDTSTESNQRQRHNGKYDSTKYRLYRNGGGGALSNNLYIIENDWKVIGLQIICNVQDRAADWGDYAFDYYNEVNDGNTVEFSNNVVILEGAPAVTQTDLFGARFIVGNGESFAPPILKIYNNVFINNQTGNGADTGKGIMTDHRQHLAYIYNNTFTGFSIGVSGDDNSSELHYLKNNLFYDNVTATLGSHVNTRCNNNATDLSDLGYTAGGSDRVSQTFSFLDATNDDYHLAAADAGARNYGTNLSADAVLSFSTDIDGNGRSLWDIGADEGSVEMEATVMATGGDYSTLALWEAGMQTDLTAVGTMVFSGTRTNAIADNAALYLCRSSVYQNITADTVHSMSAQLLAENISNPTFIMAASDIWYTNNTCNSANYFTISTAGGNPAIAVAKIDGAWASADTAAVTIDTWTTGPTNYIKVYTTATARHSGVWSATKYNLSPATGIPLTVSEENVRIDGLESYSTNDHSLYINGAASSSNIYIYNSIIKGNATTSKYGIYLFSTGASSKAYVYNNIEYDYSGTTAIGIYQNDADWTTYLYNNTFSGNTSGINNNAGVITAKNNIARGSGDTLAYVGSFTSSNYNATDGTDAGDGGAQSRISQTFSFVDLAGKDFHLAVGDTGAKNSGANLYADANIAVTTDIDGQARPNSATLFDIGADETAQEIYRSAAPDDNGDNSLAAIATGGSNSMTISGSTATFTTGLATNIGVGDVLQYDSNASNSINAGDVPVFITGRTSATIFTVKTASGEIPTARAGDTYWSIFRAYTSLFYAEAGTENTAIDSNLRDFDTWSGGKDLVSSNEQWNIAAYANASYPDTTAVTIDGWTTGATNYLKVYTPTSTTEVGASQRHSGVWDEGKYRIVVDEYEGVIYVREDYVKVIGLQIDNTRTTADGAAAGIYFEGPSTLNLTASYNIIRQTGTRTSGYNGGISGFSGVKWELYNNIIYDYDYGIKIMYPDNNAIILAYNNTIIDADVIGITIAEWDATNTIYRLKNNLVQGINTNYSLTGGDTTEYVDNLSEDTTSPNNEFDSKIVAFINEANDDFHLSPIDASAKDAGTQLCDDAYLAFSTDIDGDSRPCSPGTWDIGADEVIQAMIEIKRNVNFGRGVNLKTK